ncbi:MAG: hypothetical protein HYS25_06895 [Ignavibacteriales bacterium]|nr:hypothetical protein [Ignavibacteriales bacterium]
MEITAEITGIEYKIKLSSDLQSVDYKDFNINRAPASCLVKDNKKVFAISKWISPKRSRSYPYEKVYNTLSVSKKITVIPIIKDEGYEGDRDFIQWDTISLMSLLDVYVILAYYNDAIKHKTKKDKVTKQQFDNNFILSKIKEIGSYHSSALHWNLKEVGKISQIIKLVQRSYLNLGASLSVRFHNAQGMEDFKNQFSIDVNTFMELSRAKAKEAQARESKTSQPKEFLKTKTKATITIKNYLGGLYFLTTDEILIKEKTVHLIECKHTKKSLIPSKSDIKDGLLKMILYSNLEEVTVDGKAYKAKPVLNITSSKLSGELNSSEAPNKINDFFIKNKFNTLQRNFVTELFLEAKTNNFNIILQNGA